MSGSVLPVPSGWSMVGPWGDGARYVRKAGQLQAVLSPPEEVEGDGRKWWHLSVSHFTGRAPTFAEMRDTKEAFLGDRYAAMVFPPREFYVSQVGLNPNVLHLWATDDGWPLPEFSEGGGTL